MSNIEQQIAAQIAKNKHAYWPPSNLDDRDARRYRLLRSTEAVECPEVKPLWEELHVNESVNDRFDAIVDLIAERVREWRQSSVR